MILKNEDIGHKHLRTTLILKDKTEIVFQEATIANLVRAYITVKTHPVINKVILKGERIIERKEDFAEWQLLEVIK